MNHVITIRQEIERKAFAIEIAAAIIVSMQKDLGFIDYFTSLKRVEQEDTIKDIAETIDEYMAKII